MRCSFLCLDLWHHFSPQVHEILRTQLKSPLPQEGLPGSFILIAAYSSLHSSHFMNIQEHISVTYPVTLGSSVSDGRAWVFVLVDIFPKHPGERLWICDRTGWPGSQCYQLSLGSVGHLILRMWIILWLCSHLNVCSDSVFMVCLCRCSPCSHHNFIRCMCSSGFWTHLHVMK